MDVTNPGSGGNGGRVGADAKRRPRRKTRSSSASAPLELDRLLAALRAAEAGDFSVRLPVHAEAGAFADIARAFNGVVGQSERLTTEIVRVERVVGREGRMTERATLGDVAGGWQTSVACVNALIGDLVQPTTEVARVISAVAEGDFTQKMALEIDGQQVKGEFLRIGTTVNSMVAQLSSFAAEVTRVAKEVGTDGKLGGQAEVPDAAGIWRDLTDNVNQLANNLTAQVRNIADVTTSVAKGDLSKKITVDARGEVLELKNTINTMVDQLNSFAAEVTRVAKEVGTDGKLGGQAIVPGVSGTWKDLTDNVNFLANNLTAQVRNIAEVTTAVARGDLSKKISVDAKGEVHELKATINTMVDQLNSFAAEVTRVAKEVGTEGKLGGQAEVSGVSGVWKGLTDNVNFMASNLTTQVRGIVKVVTAVAGGDLSQTLVVDAKGEIAALADTLNSMTKTLGIFAQQVTSVARTVGVEGKLGAQAEVPGVAGTWKDLTENVNLLANNLTAQVRNIAEVTTAVANGDLSRKISVDARGEVNELKNTINTMVDQLRSFAGEVTRVAKEVGTEGRLGGQADVKGVSGTWKDLTDNVNVLAGNLTDQVRNIAKVTTAVANGDLSQKITVDVRGEVLALKDTINTMVDQLRSFASEVTRVAKEVGTEGKLGGQAEVEGVSGTWKDLTDNVNVFAGNLTDQVRNIAKVTTAIANGDLSQKITVEARGEVLALKNTINTTVDQLRSFAAEVTRVAKEVGSEGKLGGQAEVRGVSGTWKDLTENVNFMASNLTTQVRGIVRVVTAVANGDLSQKLVVDAKGEVAALADTINGMTDTLGIFAEQVTTVAREVGFEGKLGGQAKVPGATGTWRQLTDNVNQLAGQLTAQIRAISDVATAVTNGDLTRSIDVEAAGEVATLKDNLNQMIVNLKETTQKNTEQDWLKTNLAGFSGMMQGQKDLETVSRLIMSELTPLVGAHHGAFFMMDTDGDEPALKLTSTYAYRERKSVGNRFKLGESLIGQCALERKTILLTRVPADYIQISSGLGQAPPLNIIVIPVIFEGDVKAVIELASFSPFSAIHQLFLDQLMESIGVVLNMISANMRTEQLLQQSQGLTQELQSQSKELTQQQDELKRSNAELEKQALELEEKARMLEEQKTKVEAQNREVEQARSAIEEKAEQLTVVSKYKSEFLANMSHELRTPLNSLLILAKLLADNSEANLSDKQIEYAKTIYASGGELLALINEILDLSKVEAGKMPVEARKVAVSDILHFVERGFSPVATEKNLEFTVEAEPSAPSHVVVDPQRLQQILKNLLANAFKFTERGSVSLRVVVAPRSTRFSNPALQAARSVVAFSVTDTGIGIPRSKERVIFEAFQQADGTTSRKYGGTGLGLSISRDIAQLLGGEIQVRSQLGRGSTFTLFLPESYRKAKPDAERSRISALPPPARAAEPVALDTLGQVDMAPPDPSVLRPVEDDRELMREGDRVLLVVEDDPRFARILAGLARDNGFKVVVAERGDTAVALANELMPDAITLDIQLPVIDGRDVLGRLKKNPRTRHIPVHVISILERGEPSDSLGAFAYLEKPVSREKLEEALRNINIFLQRRARRLLVVEDDPAQLRSIIELVAEGDDVVVTGVRTAEEALQALEEGDFDCLVADLRLPELDGFALLEQIKTQERFRALPVVVYSIHDLTPEEAEKVAHYADTVISKTAADSPERLLEATALFLHRVEETLPPRTRSLLQPVRDASASLAGKRVLVVDDDVRNVFAITSALEREAIEVTYAPSGRECIELLQQDSAFDVVLMDVMMPDMDGYEAMQRIRAEPAWSSLPIIAVTARALKDDREKCIRSGASDYLPKPVNLDKLMDLIRVWTRS